jgi:hypothetical protein
MPADIRSFFGGGPKASQGSQDKPKKDEVCSLCVQLVSGVQKAYLFWSQYHAQKF